MVDVLNTFLPAEVRTFIEYKEWSIKTTEGVHMFVERGGKVIPTLCINGRRTHESVIPTLDELYEALARGARTDEQRRVLQAAYVVAQAAYEASDPGRPC